MKNAESYSSSCIEQTSCNVMQCMFNHSVTLARTTQLTSHKLYETSVRTALIMLLLQSQVWRMLCILPVVQQSFLHDASSAIRATTESPTCVSEYCQCCSSTSFHMICSRTLSSFGLWTTHTRMTAGCCKPCPTWTLLAATPPSAKRSCILQSIWADCCDGNQADGGVSVKFMEKCIGWLLSRKVSQHSLTLNHRVLKAYTARTAKSLVLPAIKYIKITKSRSPICGVANLQFVL